MKKLILSSIFFFLFNSLAFSQVTRYIVCDNPIDKSDINYYELEGLKTEIIKVNPHTTNEYGFKYTIETNLPVKIYKVVARACNDIFGCSENSDALYFKNAVPEQIQNIRLIKSEGIIYLISDKALNTDLVDYYTIVGLTDKTEIVPYSSTSTLGIKFDLNSLPIGSYSTILQGCNSWGCSSPQYFTVNKRTPGKVTIRVDK